MNTYTPSSKTVLITSIIGAGILAATVVSAAVVSRPASPEAPTACSAAPLAAPQLKTIQLKIQGMKSAACPAVVKAALRGVAGVLDVQADVDTRTVSIDIDAAQTSAQEIQAVIKDKAGFDSEIL